MRAVMRRCTALMQSDPMGISHQSAAVTISKMRRRALEHDRRVDLDVLLDCCSAITKVRSGDEIIVHILSSCRYSSIINIHVDIVSTKSQSANTHLS